MSQNTPPAADANQLVGLAESLPPVVVDCSHWDDDIPPDQWCTGELLGVARSVPRVVVDFLDRDAAPTPSQLSVRVQFEDGELTDSFVRAIQQADPTLQVERTPLDAPPTVVVALRNHAAVVALYGAFQGLQTAGCVIGPEENGFRVQRKAS